MIDELRRGHQEPIQERDNQISAIEYENVSLQGETKAKDQEIAALQRRYVRYLESEDKTNGIIIIAKKIIKQLSIPIYLHVGSMSIESTRLDCCLHVINVAPYLQMEIHQMPLTRTTSVESIGWL